MFTDISKGYSRFLSSDVCSVSTNDRIDGAVWRRRRHSVLACSARETSGYPVRIGRKASSNTNEVVSDVCGRDETLSHFRTQTVKYFRSGCRSWIMEKGILRIFRIWVFSLRTCIDEYYNASWQTDQKGCAFYYTILVPYITNNCRLVSIYWLVRNLFTPRWLSTHNVPINKRIIADITWCYCTESLHSGSRNYIKFHITIEGGTLDLPTYYS